MVRLKLRLRLRLHDAIYRLRFYSNSLIHILSLSNSHNNVASIQKNPGDKSHRVIVASHDVIYRLRSYSNSLIHILLLSILHSDVASIQKNWGDKSHYVIAVLSVNTGKQGLLQLLLQATYKSSFRLHVFLKVGSPHANREFKISRECLEIIQSNHTA